MEENREQILSDFQSCTGIEDVGEAIMYLEASNWSLLGAIHTVIPDDSQTLPSEREIDTDMEVSNAAPNIPGVGALSAIIPDFVRVIQRPDMEVNNIHDRFAIRNIDISMDASPEIIPARGDNVIVDDSPRITPPLIMNHVIGREDGPSRAVESRLIKFNVRYKSFVVTLEVPDSTTVGEVKIALQSECGVPVCRQDLTGWHQNHITDDTSLSSLQLPPHSTLYLTAGDPASLSAISSNKMLDYEESLSKDHKLHIIDTTNNKEYDLYFKGSKTVLEVKLGCRDVTNIPVRFQKWIGWPDAAKDENMTLAALEFESPLELILCRDDSKKTKKQLVVELTSSESSENEFEDAPECFGVDDEMFQAGTSSSRVLPLIPEGLEDELDAVRNFKKEFANRYGPSHPSFYQGTLAEALQMSCQKPARERRPLAIYLHHDASVLTNVFCAQLLCSESVISYLTINFMTWAWDLTEEANKNRLLSLVSSELGGWASNAIMNISLESMPALIIFSKVRSMSEVLTLVPGNVSLDELMTRLLHATEVYTSELSNEIREEDEREARELVKREQDAAYEVSLLADRAKEEARRHEEDKKMIENMEAQRVKEEEEIILKEEEALKKAKQMSLAEQLPPEPEENSLLPISHIRIRLPTGIMMSRRFLASDPLEILLIYIESQGYPKEGYKVLASWPRRDLIALDTRRTLEELKLYPKETLTLEER